MGGRALGTPESDYEIYVPEYFGHGFARKVKTDEGNIEVVVVIKTISIATNLNPGPFQSVDYSTHLGKPS